MANIFAILTAIVLAVAAVVAFQNKGREQEEGVGYQGWIYKRQQMEAALARKQQYLSDKRDELKATSEELAAVNADNEKKTEENEAQAAKNADLKSKLAAKEVLLILEISFDHNSSKLFLIFQLADYHDLQLKEISLLVPKAN